jgi:hypothetical protein
MEVPQLKVAGATAAYLTLRWRTRECYTSCLLFFAKLQATHFWTPFVCYSIIFASQDSKETLGKATEVPPHTPTLATKMQSPLLEMEDLVKLA